VTDLKTPEALGAVVERVSRLPGVTLHLGAHESADFRETDLIVVNPAVQRDNPFLALAIESGVPLTSEMNLFWMLNRSRTIGVTGSNGKSTTTTLIYEMLQAAGLPVRIGGNIGRSLLPEVENIGHSDWTVLELSSFQLADLDHLQRSPDIAVVTNFAPNHQDRHSSFEEYRAAKQTILRWQRAEDIAVLNADEADIATWPVIARTLSFGSHETANAQFDDDSITFHFTDQTFDLSLAASQSLPGRHNAANVAAAALAALAAGVDGAAILAGIRAFQGLPHRLEFLGEHRGRRFYNDSKSTTPEAAIAALDALKSRGPIILLAGGADKHVDLTHLADAIREHAKAVALLGQTAPRLEELIRASKPVASGISEPRGVSPGPARFRASSLHDAFSWAMQQSAPGDSILLSPGCASLDWFKNYEDRGQQFTELVREYATR
jgi:UDP-N-acetylmuramoylalanine--D-glutamate ligase